MYSRQNPSPRYAALIEQYRRMHVEGDKSLGKPPERMFAGTSLLPQAGRIKDMILSFGGRTILDYGSGKGQLYGPVPIRIKGIGEWPDIRSFWDVDEIYCYDPAHEPFNKLPEKKFDGVICTDMLEHCPEEDIPWILDEIFGYAERFVFANVACYPAVKRLPSGENAHCTVHPPQWWRGILLETSARYPDVAWEVWAIYLENAPDGEKVVEICLNG